MSIAYFVVTLLGAALAAFSAGSVFAHAKWVVEPLAAYGVPRSWWPWLGTAKAAGAAGLLVGLVVPVIGVLAGIGLVLYFSGGRHHRGPGALVLAHPVPTAVHGAGGRFLGADVACLDSSKPAPEMADSGSGAGSMSVEAGRYGPWEHPDRIQRLQDMSDAANVQGLRDARLRRQNNAHTTLLQGVGALLVPTGAGIAASVTFQQV